MDTSHPSQTVHLPESAGTGLTKRVNGMQDRTGDSKTAPPRCVQEDQKLASLVDAIGLETLVVPSPSNGSANGYSHPPDSWANGNGKGNGHGFDPEGGEGSRRGSEASTSRTGVKESMDRNAPMSTYAGVSADVQGATNALPPPPSTGVIRSSSPSTSASRAPQASASSSQLPLSFTPDATSSNVTADESSRATESDPTAVLIRRLYSRLDSTGVQGDGYEEGRERSRDGIINREEADGVSTVKMRKGKEREVLNIGGEMGESTGRQEQVLKRVDRYGFFSDSHPAALASQHHRLATLHSAPLLSIPSPKSIFRRTKSANAKPTPSIQATKSTNRASHLPSQDPISQALESTRISKWASMLTPLSRDSGGNISEWTIPPSWWEGKGAGGGKYKMFQKRVFKGVPDRWRRAVWGLMMERWAKEEEGRGEKVMGLKELEKLYFSLLRAPSNSDIQIDLDVPRTISGHVLFHTRYGQGQRALFHVLHAFGLHCDSIGVGGYCQGMGPIAACFLSYFEPERAFASMVRLFDQYGIRHIFEPGFPGLIEAFYVQEKLVEFLMPGVHAAFITHGISTSSYATKWYITLFANSVPFGTQLRLWDGLLLEDIDFLVITSLAIIWSFRVQFSSPTASFESILSLLSSYFLVESDDALLRFIRKTLRQTDLRTRMQGWRVEWKGFVKDGSSSKRVT